MVRYRCGGRHSLLLATERLAPGHTHSAYRKACGIMSVFDVTDFASFNRVTQRHMEMERYAPDGVKCVLVGNHTDRPNRLVSSANAAQLADSLGIPYYETSAKDNIGVEAAFMALVTAIVFPDGAQQRLQPLQRSVLAQRSAQ